MTLILSSRHTTPRQALHRQQPPFDAVPFDPTKVIATEVGSVPFTFADGKSTTVAYTYGGVTRRKAITREIFASPGTVCF